MSKGGPLPPLSLGQEQRKQLVSWSWRRKIAQALAMRRGSFAGRRGLEQHRHRTVYNAFSFVRAA
jgi:hypothetical protein